jgi:hypothetical protein
LCNPYIALTTSGVVFRKSNLGFIANSFLKYASRLRSSCDRKSALPITKTKLARVCDSEFSHKEAQKAQNVFELFVLLVAKKSDYLERA